MAERYCETGVPHVFDPDNHFCCKLRYWRENGAPAVKYQMGREFFHEKTLAGEARRTVEEAKAQGLEPVSRASRWV